MYNKMKNNNPYVKTVVDEFRNDLEGKGCACQPGITDGDFICVDCGDSFCFVCFLTEHQGHRIYSTYKFIEKKWHEISGYITDFMN